MSFFYLFCVFFFHKGKPSVAEKRRWRTIDASCFRWWPMGSQHPHSPSPKTSSCRTGGDRWGPVVPQGAMEKRPMEPWRSREVKTFWWPPHRENETWNTMCFFDDTCLHHCDIVYLYDKYCIETHAYIYIYIHMCEPRSKSLKTRSFLSEMCTKHCKAIGPPKSDNLGPYTTVH